MEIGILCQIGCTRFIFESPIRLMILIILISIGQFIWCRHGNRPGNRLLPPSHGAGYHLSGSLGSWCSTIDSRLRLGRSYSSYSSFSSRGVPFIRRNKYGSQRAVFSCLPIVSAIQKINWSHSFVIPQITTGSWVFSNSFYSNSGLLLYRSSPTHIYLTVSHLLWILKIIIHGWIWWVDLGSRICQCCRR